MGIVIGVAAAVTEVAATAAAEAAATAAVEGTEVAATEAAAEAAATEAAAEAAAEAEAEAAAEAEAEASSEAEAEAAAKAAAKAAAAKMFRAIAKLSKLIKEYFAIDAVFKTAEVILREHDGTSAKIKKLMELIQVLVEMGNKLTTIRNWIDEHKDDTVKLDGFDVPVDSGVLAKIMTPLAAGAGVLQHLSDKVSQQNDMKKPITGEQISSMGRSLLKVANTFESLVSFKAEHSTTVPILSTFPISEDEVSAWKAVIFITIQEQ